MKDSFRVVMILMSIMSLPHISEAAGIEKLVMPGPLTQDHAEYEDQCGSCHQRFNRRKQNQLCLACHEEVADDLGKRQGYHGLDSNIAGTDCATCHTDHKGREFDIVTLDRNSFNHKLTNFELHGAHSDQKCDVCHTGDQKFREAPLTCIGCHREDDSHEGHLGEACADCHTEDDWKPASFDHDTTEFALLGAHAEATCEVCHADYTFQNTETECVACHLDDDAHQGRFGQQCGDCHTAEDWQAPLFDHDRDTDFLLTGGHDGLSCGDCHSADPHLDRLGSTCYSCHADDDEHLGHNGKQCELCHVSSSWPEVTFRHEIKTKFWLHGAHGTIACAACHVEPVFESSLQADCYACHEAHDAHNGQEGRECGSCHNATAWADDVAFDHDLSSFPLLGVHAEQLCESCHESNAFQDAPTECLDCHLEDDTHAAGLGPDCALCHNPVAWDRWVFNHNIDTRFALDGAHESAICKSCHVIPLQRFLGGNRDCVSCHRVDDVHDGEFDDDCARCHTTRSFSELHDFR